MDVAAVATAAADNDYDGDAIAHDVDNDDAER